MFISIYYLFVIMDDIDINQIDYKFVVECNDKTKLRKALKILKADGILPFI